MKRKWSLFASIFYIIIGLLAVISFTVLAINSENMAKWVVTLILSVLFIIFGVYGIINHIKEK